ncbi:flagellar M-ring protein FliF (plasmid) [Paroceanicella profunda]|uniref:Flagellar M-ring protein n=1 Tax=Paroceanicella profunda TaxID=2579971 RepID=A0A5B8FJR4_9RHOB|nr:flagellar basal-body MS-ring/collar protein FliF [Paroceanicella profunda]QDL94757.1 flagellar M-ring protein FliF [Paroceanicella profunda]
MDRLASLWKEMDARKRILAILAGLATVAVVIALARLASAPSMALLYAGLEPRAAAEVITSLEQKGVPYELRGQAIYVPTDERDRVRLGLASENLPATGIAGYELLDGLSGFGTTAEMFDATYWRAKEGELARTLLAAPGMRAARVHIANPVRRPFERDKAPTASVILTSGGGTVDETQARAARYLVASAVAGLNPDNVTVIDSVAGVILAAGDDAPAQVKDLSGTGRAEELRAKLERLLAARVGDGKAVVEVTVDTVMESETVSERVIDPASRVAIAEETSEKSESSEGNGPGGVTVASQLPDPAQAGQGGQTSKRSSSETRGRSNFEVSEVRRERVRMPGDVRRLSVAVLVDGLTTTAADGTTTWTQRPEAELVALGELVRSAVGFDEARGDVVTIDSLEFSPEPVLGTRAEAGVFDLFAVNAMTLIQLGVLAGVALLLGLFVLRPMLAAPPVALTQADGDALEDGQGMINPEELAASLEAAQQVLGPTPESEARLLTLREAIAERSEEATLLLRNWLETREPGEDAA